MNQKLVLSNPLRVQLTHAMHNSNLDAVAAALDAGASAYEAMLMCVMWPPGFQLALERSSEADRERFLQRLGASAELKATVRAYSMRAHLRSLLP